jgi:hypothetical protein
MLDNKEKINLIINKLNNIEVIINTHIERAEILSDKYSLDEVLLNCNAIKLALIKELESLGGIWPIPLD